MDSQTTATLPITAVWPGQPYPRGATWDGEGVNFSLFAANAVALRRRRLEKRFERVQICRRPSRKFETVDVRFSDANESSA